MTAHSAARTVEPLRPPEYRYHLLRAVLGLGWSGIGRLDPARLADAARKADASFELEQLVLESVEAADVVIPAARLDAAMAELAGRYSDRRAFLSDLTSNGLDEGSLRRALQRELIFDGAMQRVAARRPPITDLDERLFFELHCERFTRPERRTVRHILVTINQDYAENRRTAARRRIEELAARLDGRPQRFPTLARRHSECPSALQQGRLGTLQRGRLYPELDTVLFALRENAVSQPVESQMGFHLLWCEKVHPERTLPLSKARPLVRQLLDARAARTCQAAWIAELRRARGLRAAP